MPENILNQLDSMYVKMNKLVEYIRENKPKQEEINEVDKQAFVDASGPIYDEFGSKVAGAKEMIDQIQALAK